MQKPINIQLDEVVLKISLKAYINDLINKKKDSNRYTKFDSENDALLGALGEYAFAKFLYNKGLRKNIDYLKIDIANATPGDDNFVQVGNKFYDKYDFLVSNVQNQEPFRIDVKTQKYVGKPTNDWQFAVNSNTIDKINKKTREIDKFLFIFSRMGTEDILKMDLNNKSIEELEMILNNDIELVNCLKIKKINMEIMGVIDYDKFIFLSSKYEEGEAFRIYSKYDKFNEFTTQSPMHRINLNYLSNPDKVIPNRILNLHNIDENKVELLYAKTDLNQPFFDLYVNDKLYKCPYDKLYTDSRFSNQSEFLNNMCSMQKQTNNRYK